MAVNGARTIEARDEVYDLDQTGVKLPPGLLGPEIGTGFDELFPQYETPDGKNVFDYGDFESREIQEAIDRDGKVGALEQVLCLPLRMLAWTVEPADGDSGEAELIRQILETPANHGGMSTPMTDVIGQMTAAIANRKSYHEKVYRLGTGDLAGKVVLDQLGWRPPTTCRLLRDKKSGAFRGYEQDHPQKDLPVWIKTHRAFVYVHGKHRDPLRGVSDLTVAYWCYKTKQKLRFLWYQFLEGQSLPRTLVKGDDQTEATNQAKRVATLKAAGVLGIDKRFEIETLESNGEGAREFKEALRWLDGEMSGSVLAGFTDLTSAASEGRGSFALSKDQSDLFLVSRNAVAREMAACIDSYLIADLVKWNFGADAKAPHFKFAPVGQQDIDSAIAMLSTFGVAQQIRVPTEFIMELVRQVAKKLDMDMDKLDQAIEEETRRLKEMAKTEQEAKVAGVAGAVNAAANAVHQREISNRQEDRADRVASQATQSGPAGSAGPSKPEGNSPRSS